MKILLLTDTERRPSLGYYYKHAIEQMGHEVIGYDHTRLYSALKAVNFVRRRVKLLLAPMLRTIERDVLRLVEERRPDLFLTIKGELLTRRLLIEVRRRRNIPRVNWFADPVARLFDPPYLLLDALPEYDYFFVKDEYFLNELRLLRPERSYLLELGYDPTVFRPVGESRELRCDVAFVGTHTPKRAAILGEIADLGLRIYGRGWDELPRGHRLAACYTGRTVFGDEHARLFCSARINVNIHEPLEGFGLNARTMEISGAGGFQIVDWRYGLDKYFDDGREIVTFRTPAELRERIRYFLDHPEERAEIARCAHERAGGQFTIQKRFQELLEIVRP